MPGVLVDSPGSAWDYQASPDLIEVLRKEIQRHYYYYALERQVNKTTMPLYLFLSGAGTGKSRNATELHETALKCFDGTYHRHQNEQLAGRLRNPMVFHVSLENGTSLRPEEDPWRAIGGRMLLQLLQEDRAQHLDIESIISEWHPPTPCELIKLVASSSSPLQQRTIFLIVDGLHNISDSRMHAVLTKLGDLTHSGFIIVCATSTVSGPIDQFLKGSRRRRISLPCSPLDPPRVKGQPVFDMESIVRKVIVSDCGGHGRALELLLDVFPRIPADIGPEVKSLMASELAFMYRGVLPGETDSIAIVKAVLTNRRLCRYTPIPGTTLTPDEVCQNGLIRFEDHVNRPTINPSGYFRVPYIWLLALCMTYEHNEFFDELQLLDYRDFRSKEDPAMPGGFSWEDFEKSMIEVRKIKSHAFDDGENITVGELHGGGVMQSDTARICFMNHHLIDDVSCHQLSTKTNFLNQRSWKIETRNLNHIDLRTHRHIVRNAAGAPAADAVLSLDCHTPRAETQQYKMLQRGRLNFGEKRAKAAGPDDVFVLFCTSPVPSLSFQGQYQVPRGSVLVTKENWDIYFGPYAGRSYVFAEQVAKNS